MGAVTRAWARAIAASALALALGAAAALDIPHTFTAGEVISAAEMNENFAAVGAAIAGLDARTAPDPLPALMIRSTDQPTPPTAFLADFTDVDLDTDGLFDPGTSNELRSSVAGLYLIAAHATWEANDAGARGIMVAHGGTTVLSTFAPAAAAGSTRLGVSGVLMLGADEPVIVLLQHSAGPVGTSLDVSTRVSLVWLGHLP